MAATDRPTSAIQAPELITPPVHLLRMSGLLGVVSALAAAGTLFIPDVLSGPAVMNGSARGTALVVLFAAVPILAGAMRAAHRGSTRGLAVWLGVAAYLTYNAVMFCFATPLNPLFPLYVAMLSLSIFVLAGLAIHAAEVGRQLPDSRGPGWVAAYIGVVVALNGLLWLRGVASAVVAHEPTSFLDGTGLTTNPVYVQTWRSGCRSWPGWPTASSRHRGIAWSWLRVGWSSGWSKASVWPLTSGWDTEPIRPRSGPRPVPPGSSWRPPSSDSSLPGPS